MCGSLPLFFVTVENDEDNNFQVRHLDTCETMKCTLFVQIRQEH